MEKYSTSSEVYQVLKKTIHFENNFALSLSLHWYSVIIITETDVTLAPPLIGFKACFCPAETSRTQKQWEP